MNAPPTFTSAGSHVDPAAELDDLHTVELNQAASPPNNFSVVGHQNNPSTTALEQQLRGLDTARRRGILSGTEYQDNRTVAIAHWLHNAHSQAPLDDVEDVTAEFIQHPHAPALNEGQSVVVINKSITALPEESAPMSPGQSSLTLDPFQPGRTIRGRYVLEEVIGRGGFASVYRARDLRRDAMDGKDLHVAVKVLRPEVRERHGATTRLKREFRQTHLLSHDAVRRVFDLDAHDGVWFMVMELLEGETLAASLRRLSGIAVPLIDAQAPLAACVEALSFAHEHGIVHGDFKPANLFMLHDGSVRIVDFGSSPDLNGHSPGEAAESITHVATPAYASPQVLQGEAAVPSDDLFSFACVAFELLTGSHPFARRSSLTAQLHNETVMGCAALLPHQLSALQRGLAWRREDRPGSIREFFTALTTPEAAEGVRTHGAEHESMPIVLTVPAPVIAPDLQRAPTATPTNMTEPMMAPVTAMAMEPAAPDGLIDAMLVDEHAANQASIAQASTALPIRVEAAAVPLAMRMRPSVPAHRFRPYGLAALFLLGYLGFLALHDPQAELTPPSATSAVNQLPQKSTVDPFAYKMLSTAAPPSRARTESRVDVAPTERTTVTVNKVAPSVSFDTSSMTVSTHAVAAAINLKRVNGRSGRLRVKWRLKADSAAAGRDYDGPVSGFAEFADNQQVRTLFVPLLNDPERRGDRSFMVELINVSPGVEISPRRNIKVTIVGSPT